MNHKENRLNDVCNAALNGDIKLLENYFRSNLHRKSKVHDDFNQASFEMVLKYIFDNDLTSTLKSILNNEIFKDFFTIENLSGGFILACKKNNVEMVQALLEAGADIHYKSDRGFAWVNGSNRNMWKKLDIA
jgi:ankyrin repeat protein